MEHLAPRPFWDTNRGRALVQTAVVAAPVSTGGLIVTGALSGAGAILSVKEAKKSSQVPASPDTAQQNSTATAQNSASPS